MKSLFVKRKSVKEMAARHLALPPGYRKIYVAQKVDNSRNGFQFGSIPFSNAIQNLDPTSAHFGEFHRLNGYDD